MRAHRRQRCRNKILRYVSFSFRAAFQNGKPCRCGVTRYRAQTSGPGTWLQVHARSTRRPSGPTCDALPRPCAFRAMRAPEEDFDEGTSRMRVISADVQLTIPFQVGTWHARYSSSWRAQWHRTPLVPQDRFSIGGRYSVRGFDGELTLSGEHGRVWRLAQARNSILGLTAGTWPVRLHAGSWAKTLPVPSSVCAAVSSGFIGTFSLAHRFPNPRALKQTHCPRVLRSTGLTDSPVNVSATQEVMT